MMNRFAIAFVALLPTFTSGCDLELRGGSGTLGFIKMDFMSHRKAELALRNVIFAQEDIYIRMPNKSGRRMAMLLADWMKTSPRPKPYLDSHDQIQIFSKMREWDAELIYAECFRVKGATKEWTFSPVVPITISPRRISTISVHMEVNLLSGGQSIIYKPPTKARWYKPSAWRPVGGSSNNERRYCD
ncbi:hypothetical protein ACFL3C_04475 [Patescibacteria group bacterium]